MWTLISNSLDIDFIHGDIHGRSCKKSQYSMNHVHKPGYVLYLSNSDNAGLLQLLYNLSLLLDTWERTSLGMYFIYLMQIMLNCLLVYILNLLLDTWEWCPAQVVAGEPKLQVFWTKLLLQEELKLLPSLWIRQYFFDVKSPATNLPASWYGGSASRVHLQVILNLCHGK